jgi:hypothetical protein
MLRYIFLNIKLSRSPLFIGNQVITSNFLNIMDTQCFARGKSPTAHYDVKNVSDGPEKRERCFLLMPENTKADFFDSPVEPAPGLVLLVATGHIHWFTTGRLLSGKAPHYILTDSTAMLLNIIRIF